MDYPVAVFFSCIALMLVGMTIWGIEIAHGGAQGLPADPHHARRPPVHRPLAAAWVNLAFLGLGGKAAEWFSLDGPPSVWISFVASMLLLAFIMRKG